MIRDSVMLWLHDSPRSTNRRAGQGYYHPPPQDYISQGTPGPPLPARRARAGSGEAHPGSGAAVEPSARRAAPSPAWPSPTPRACRTSPPWCARAPAGTLGAAALPRGAAGACPARPRPGPWGAAPVGAGGSEGGGRGWRVYNREGVAAGWAWGAGEGCRGVVVVCPVLKLVADSRVCLRGCVMRYQNTGLFCKVWA